jgi:putative hydrolase of the HAD superfamily
MIKNIVFDIGNVLIEYHPSRIVGTKISDPAEQALIFKAVFQSRGWALLDRGLITFAEHYAHLEKQFPRYRDEIKWLLDHWHEDMPPIPGMAALVEKIKRAGFQQFVLSNTSVRYYTYAPQLDIFNRFDGITISAEIHVLKPQKEIYDRFCQIHGVVPEQCLFIDDRPENVKGAINAGWQAYRFKDSKTLQTALEEILQIDL